MQMRRTKIIATLGPATDSRESLASIIPHAAQLCLHLATPARSRPHPIPFCPAHWYRRDKTP